MNSRISAMDSKKLKEYATHTEKYVDEQCERTESLVTDIKKLNTLYTGKAIFKVIVYVVLLVAVVVAAFYMKDHVPDMVKQLYRRESPWVNYDFYYPSSLTMILIFTVGLCVAFGRRIYYRAASISIERRISGAGKLKEEMLNAKEIVRKRCDDLCNGIVRPFEAEYFPLSKLKALHSYAPKSKDGKNTASKDNNYAVRAVAGSIISIVFLMIIAKYFMTGLLSVIDHGSWQFAIVQYLYLLVYNVSISVCVFEMARGVTKYTNDDKSKKNTIVLFRVLVVVAILATAVYYCFIQYTVALEAFTAKGAEGAIAVSGVFVVANVMSLGVAGIVRVYRKGYLRIRKRIVLATVTSIVYGLTIFLPQFLLVKYVW